MDMKLAPVVNEYGYLIKDLKTNKLDTETRPVASKHHKDKTTLVEGYEWVKVKVSYEEVNT